MKNKILILFLIGSILPSTAHANDECIKGITKFDACKKARELSDQIAVTLPIKMSQNMTWESIAAVGDTLIINIRLSYNKDLLEETLKPRGLSLEYAKEALIEAAQNVCNEDTPTAAFVHLGGKIRYFYNFNKGERFSEIEINDCN